MQESLRATSASAGASLLAEHGVCWLDAALAPAAFRSVADVSRSSFTALLSAISGRHEAECRGLPAHLHRLARMPVKCAEVVERDGGRFDCRYGCDDLPQLLLGPATLLAQLLGRPLLRVPRLVRGRRPAQRRRVGDRARLRALEVPLQLDDLRLQRRDVVRQLGRGLHAHDLARSLEWRQALLGVVTDKKPRAVGSRDG